MNNKNYENSETLAFFYMHPRVFAQKAIQNQTIYGRRISTALSSNDTLSIVTEELTEKPARPVDALRQMSVSIMILACL